MEEVSRNLGRVKYKQSRESGCLEGWKILIVSGKELLVDTSLDLA